MKNQGAAALIRHLDRIKHAAYVSGSENWTNKRWEDLFGELERPQAVCTAETKTAESVADRQRRMQTSQSGNAQRVTSMPEINNLLAPTSTGNRTGLLSPLVPNADGSGRFNNALKSDAQLGMLYDNMIWDRNASTASNLMGWGGTIGASLLGPLGWGAKGVMMASRALKAKKAYDAMRKARLAVQTASKSTNFATRAGAQAAQFGTAAAAAVPGAIAGRAVGRGVSDGMQAAGATEFLSGEKPGDFKDPGVLNDIFNANQIGHNVVNGMIAPGFATAPMRAFSVNPLQKPWTYLDKLTNPAALKPYSQLLPSKAINTAYGINMGASITDLMTGTKLIDWTSYLDPNRIAENTLIPHSQFRGTAADFVNQNYAHYDDKSKKELIDQVESNISHNGRDVRNFTDATGSPIGGLFTNRLKTRSGFTSDGQDNTYVDYSDLGGKAMGESVPAYRSVQDTINRLPMENHSELNDGVKDSIANNTRMVTPPVQRPDGSVQQYFMNPEESAAGVASTNPYLVRQSAAGTDVLPMFDNTKSKVPLADSIQSNLPKEGYKFFMQGSNTPITDPEMIDQIEFANGRYYYPRRGADGRTQYVELQAVKTSAWSNPFGWFSSPKLDPNDPNYRANLQRAREVAKNKNSLLNFGIGSASVLSGGLKGIGDTAAFGLHRLSPFAENNVTDGERSAYVAGAGTGILAPGAVAKLLGKIGFSAAGKAFGTTGRPGVINLLAQRGVDKADDAYKSTRATTRAFNRATDKVINTNWHLANRVQDARAIGQRLLQKPSLPQASKALAKAERFEQVSPHLDPLVNQGVARFISAVQGDGPLDGIPFMDNR